MLVLFAFNISGKCQLPNISWQKTIGGNKAESPLVIHLDSDSGLVIGGFSESDISGEKTDTCRGSLDYFIVNLFPGGNINWQKTIGGTNFDVCYSVLPMPDKSYILGGLSFSSISGDKTINTYGGSDYWVLKLDSLKKTVWQIDLGGNYPDDFVTIIPTAESGYLIGGTSLSGISGTKSDSCRGGSDYWIIKIDSAGTVQWQRTFGGSGSDVLTCMITTHDFGFILGGFSFSNISGDKTENSKGASDIWIIKIDSLGNILWQKTIGGNQFDLVNSMQQFQNGDYILAGSSDSNISGDKNENSRGEEDFWVLRLDSVGNIIWQRTIGGDLGDWANDVKISPNENLLLLGTSGSGISGEKTEISRGLKDIWLVELDSIGYLTRQKTIGGSLNEEGYSLICIDENDYVIAAMSASDIGFEKAEDSRGGTDWWIIKLSTLTKVVEIANASGLHYIVDDNSNLIIVNGLPDIWNGDVSISDILGRKVRQSIIKNGGSSYQISINDLSTGVFFINMNINGTVVSKKFLFSKN